MYFEYESGGNMNVDSQVIGKGKHGSKVLPYNSRQTSLYLAKLPYIPSNGIHIVLFRSH
jgi:hypothetical protein